MNSETHPGTEEVKSATCQHVSHRQHSVANTASQHHQQCHAASMPRCLSPLCHHKQTKDETVLGHIFTLRYVYD
ncbi:hypothetical protein E2C01_094432 [Portunus trituberculatus]|uniref:Uncharacterized protein n=1 Tax=Portunus trituberculatus TaxID=210409 RepID=A0A5B7K1M6_PORTR|nr:hypothetical protein [Portunus trituberculatus]